MPDLGATALAAIIGSAVAGTAGTVGGVLTAKQAAKQRQKEMTMNQIDVPNDAFGEELANVKRFNNADNANLSLRPGGPNIIFPKKFSR